MTSSLTGSEKLAISDWKATRPAERQRALDHPQAADTKDRGERQAREQGRQHVREMIERRQSSCSAFKCLGLDAGPLAEGVVLQAAGLEGFDAAHRADGGADELALLQREAAAEILPACAR